MREVMNGECAVSKTTDLTRSLSTSWREADGGGGLTVPTSERISRRRIGFTRYHPRRRTGNGVVLTLLNGGPAVYRVECTADLEEILAEALDRRVAYADASSVA